MPDELKPCPFCGSEAIPNAIDGAYVNCSRAACYMSGEWRKYGVHPKIWNTRPAEDSLSAQVAQLESELDRALAQEAENARQRDIAEQKVAALTAQLAEMTADRDSETAWAAQYKQERDTALIGFKALWENTIKFDISPSSDDADAMNAALALLRKY